MVHQMAQAPTMLRTNTSKVAKPKMVPLKVAQTLPWVYKVQAAIRDLVHLAAMLLLPRSETFALKVVEAQI